MEKYLKDKTYKISPNKTISGAIGSLCLSTLFFSSSIFYFNQKISINIIFIAIITSIGCQIGDLFFSYLKRKIRIKDTGNILPGHGGILDRLDGIFLGLPLGFIFFMIIY